MTTLLAKGRLRSGSTRADRHVPGETGTWVFIFGDMLMFAVLFGTYLYYRAEDPELFSSSQQALNPSYGAVNTLLLLVSSLLVVTAVQSVRRANGAAPWLILGAVACGIAFSVLKVFEYSEKLSAGLDPSTNDFFMCYFIFTGLHWFHLLIGLGVLAYLFRLSRKPALTTRQFAFFEGGASFWHMVDLLWIVLFSLIYLVQ